VVARCSALSALWFDPRSRTGSDGWLSRVTARLGRFDLRSRLSPTVMLDKGRGPVGLSHLRDAQAPSL
jgi:hypothetical protein